MMLLHLVIFYFQGSGFTDIYCLDLLQVKWYKLECNVPPSISFKCNVIKHNQDIHFLQFTKKQHFKIAAHNLLPKEVVVARRKYYNPLIFGYIRYQETNDLVPNIPFVLKRLILDFYDFL